MIDRRRLRRMFLSALASEGLDYTSGGCQVVHVDLIWSMSLAVDGTGTDAPYRLIVGASLPGLGDSAPRDAGDCDLVWPLAYEGRDTAGATPRMPDAVFPEWPGTDEARAAVIAECVAAVVRYARKIDSLEALRVHYALGDYEGALLVAPLRRLLEQTT